MYLHMHLVHLWELTQPLPEIFIDGLPLRQKIYPWILNYTIDHWRHLPLVWVSPEVEWYKPLFWRSKVWFRIRQIRALTAIFLGWVFLPLTIGFMTFRFLVRHDNLSYVLLSLLAISVLSSSLSYQSAKASVRRE